jgi:hypothetical protein
VLNGKGDREIRLTLSVGVFAVADEDDWRVTFLRQLGSLQDSPAAVIAAENNDNIPPGWRIGFDE